MKAPHHCFKQVFSACLYLIYNKTCAVYSWLDRLHSKIVFSFGRPWTDKGSLLKAEQVSTGRYRVHRRSSRIAPHVHTLNQRLGKRQCCSLWTEHRNKRMPAAEATRVEKVSAFCPLTLASVLMNSHNRSGLKRAAIHVVFGRFSGNSVKMYAQVGWKLGWLLLCYSLRTYCKANIQCKVKYEQAIDRKWCNSMWSHQK